MTQQELSQAAYLAAIKGLCANPEMIRSSNNTTEIIHQFALKIAVKALDIPEPD
jgi:hypothetical protein